MQHDSLLVLVTGSGPVVQLVLYLLILMSIASWGVILYKTRQVRVARRQSERFIEGFWETRNLTTIHSDTGKLGESPVAQVFQAGYEELLRLTRAKRHAGPEEGSLSTELAGVANVERAMRRATSQEITRLERMLTFLATTASATPFIGLFGTVWGIMNAFRGLSVTQSATIQAVAPGISEALIATAAGLFAAIPAVIAYNYFPADPGSGGRDGELLCGVSQYCGEALPQVAGMAFNERNGEAISQINVTPLVDVMLVLLVIFMVTAPILQQGVAVNLPQVRAGALTGEEIQLVVSVTADGATYLNKTRITEQDLTAKLQAILPRTGRRRAGHLPAAAIRPCRTARS